MAAKIVIIGGGSYLWTPTLAGDLFCHPGLGGSELVLVDIDTRARADLEAYLKKLNDTWGQSWTIRGDDLEPALDGADFVGISISTGGLETFHNDYTIPEQFGIYQSTGDTVGPAGISRSLRNIPVFVDIAQKMERLCPDAWLVHVTNPLSQLTRAVCKTSSVKCVGLCHNYYGSMGFLADYFGVDYDDIDATSVGVNHGTFLKDITVKGRPVTDELNLARYLDYCKENKTAVESGTLDDDIEAMTLKKSLSTPRLQLSFELYERFGVFPVGGVAHVAENLPFYLNDPDVMERHHIGRKGVLPQRQDALEMRRERVLDRTAGKEDMPELKKSRETFAGIIEALHTGTPFRSIVALPNRGQVENLPRDVIVETWALVSANGIHPVISGSVPTGLHGWMQTIVDEQELTVEAALTGSRDVLHQAMTVSPLVQNKDCVEELSEKLLKANRDYLPQFSFG